MILLDTDHLSVLTDPRQTRKRFLEPLPARDGSEGGDMTTAFRTAYESLLLDYLPRPVRTQHEAARKQAVKLKYLSL